MMLARVSSMLTTLLSRSRRERFMGRGNGVPGGIRTPNLLIRSQKLYPVELQAQALKIPNPKFQNEDCYFGFWDLEFRKQGGQRDSNPQQPEPQSGALPLSYGHHLNLRF